MRLDDIEQARPAVHKLMSMGFMHPEFVRLCEKKGFNNESQGTLGGQKRSQDHANIRNNGKTTQQKTSNN